MLKKMSVVLLLLCGFPALAKPVNALCKSAQGGSFVNGDGSKLNPYIICNYEQFSTISHDATLLSKWFKLGRDLSFKDKVFPMIGTMDMPFQGGFDGDGYTLSAITLTDQIRAPFRRIENAQIENLNINDIRSEGNANFHVAGLVGKADDSIIHHVNVHNLKLHSINYSGGVIGEATNSSLSYSSSDGLLEHRFGTDASGGLIGMAYEVDVFACASHVNMITTYTGQGTISGVGGLIGHAELSRIRNVFADGTINYANVPVPRLEAFGGLIGGFYRSSLTNAYYAGKMTINAYPSNSVGPVAGDAINSYSSSVFWDKDVSGVTESIVGIGKDTATMKKKSFWLNQGFDQNIWLLSSNKYPRVLGTIN